MPTVCDYGENIVGPFKQTIFLGCSVQSFGCNIGWNEQVTNLTVELVEDPCPGEKVFYNKPGHEGIWTKADPGFEEFQPSLGAPVYFRVGSFEFAGIVQGWTKKDSTAGLGMYTVNISDPRFILQNTQLIINEFDGTVGPIYNVVNPFGFLESYGFGISDMNEVGVPWSYIKLATSSLLSSQGYLEGNPYGPHGGVIFRSHDWDSKQEKFGLIRGSDTSKDTSITNDFGGEHGWITTYYVDLHDIPFAPEYYRLQSNEITLMELINLVCQDAGCDYYIELFLTKFGEKVIKVRAQQRRLQPTLGQVQQFIDTRTGVISKDVGRELRNEATQSFAMGANKQYFVEQSSYEPWFGFDTEGEPHTWGTVTDPAGVLGTMYFVNLDVRELNTTLATPLGSDSIVLTEGEMRCALGGFGSWQNYIQSYNSGGGTTTGVWAKARGFKPTFSVESLASGGDNSLKANQQFGGMMPNLANFEFNATNTQDAKKIHAFISQFTDEFYGRKALVPIDVDFYFNSESQQWIFGALPASEAWVESGASWLSIVKPSVYLDKFTTDENLVTGGVRHAANTAYVRDAGNAVTNGTYIWVSAAADPEPILKAPAAGGNTIAWAIMNFSTIAEYKTQEIGTQSYMAGGAFGIKSFKNVNMVPVLGGFGLGINADVSLGMSLKRVYPELIAVPLRANYKKYGAFGFVGPPGPVLMKADDKLSPWSYGGTPIMNLVAENESQDGLTFMQVGERGSVTWPGYPEHRIGSELRSVEDLYKDITSVDFPWSITNNNGSTGDQQYTYLPMTQAIGELGPNITAIAVNIQQGGVTTTYQLSTFTPSFGRLSKINTERLKRAAQNRVKMAKMTRKQAFMRMYTQLARNARR